MFILIVFILSFLIIRSKVRNDRRILEHKLVMIYDNMELYFTKNSKHLETDVKNYLMIFKNVAVNPEFLDPKVNATIRQLAKRPNRDKLMTSLKAVEERYPVSKEYKESFDNVAGSLFQLNFLKLRNLDICIFCSIVFLAEYSLHRGKIVKKAFDKVIGEEFTKNHKRVSKLDLPSSLQLA